MRGPHDHQRHHQGHGRLPIGLPAGRKEGGVTLLYPQRSAPMGRRASATATQLAYRYGSIRAAAIIAGLDEEAEADLAKWRNLGRRVRP